MFGLRKNLLQLLIFLVFTTVLPAQSADQLYSGGRQAFTDGLWPTAAAQFSRLLREYPADHRSDSAAYMAAVAYYNAGELERSIRILSAFPNNYPDSAWNQRVAYWEGLGHYARKNWSSAASAFERQARISEEIAYRDRALLYLGACREQLEDWFGAEQAYTELEQSSRDFELSARAVFRLGQISLSGGRPEAALAAFNRLVFDYTGSSVSRDAEYWIAESQRILGREESALESYRNFLAGVYASEYRAPALLGAAGLAAGQGEDEEALAYLDLREQEWAGGADPEHRTVLQIRAASYLRTGALRKAREAYAEILRSPADRFEEQTAAFDLAQTWIGTAGEPNAVPYLDQAAGGPDPDIAADALYNAGRILMTAGHDDAADFFRRFSGRFPDDARREESLRFLVRSCQDQEDLSGAINGLNDLVLDYPNSSRMASYLFLRGELALETGDSSAALSDFGRVTREYADSDYAGNAHSRIGFVYAGRGEHIRASEHYLQAAEKFGGTDGGEDGRRALYSAGVALLNGRDSRGAIREFSRLVDTDPGGPWAVEAAYHMGEALYDAGDYESAREAYASAARHGDARWGFEASYALGWTWFRQSDWKRAAEAFELAADKAVSEEQKHRSRYRVGLSLASSGDWGAALSHYSRALEFRPASWREEALYQYSWALMNLSRTEEAFEVSSRLVQEFPQSSLPADIPFRMGENAAAAGNFAEAVNWYDRCVEMYPDTEMAVRAGLRAALASKEAGNPVDAADRYAAWIQDHPNNAGVPAAGRSWAEAVRASGDPALAERSRNFAERLDPEHRSVAVPLYLVWVRLADLPAEAASMLERMAEDEALDPADRAEALLLRAHLYRIEGKFSRARSLYEVLIRDVPGRTGAESQEGLARSYAEDGRADDAAEAYLALSYLYPEETDLAARALREAEKLYREVGDLAEADRIRDLIVRNNRSSSGSGD